MNEIVRNFSECYFGYKINIGKDELGIKEHPELQPKIYLEKKDGKSTILFFTFPDWYVPIKDMPEKELFYDKVVIAFDPKGYDLNNIVKRAKEKKSDPDLIYDEITFNSDSIKNLGRYEIKQRDFSGVGAFVLSKKGQETVVYFAINYVQKKKIYYTIEKNTINFKTRNNIDKLPVRVLMNQELLPCLANETTSRQIEKIVKFEKGKGSISLKNENNEKVYLDLCDTYTEQGAEKKFNKELYQLICETNSTTPKNKNNKRVLDSKPICPYCHNEINFVPEAYKNGMYCDGTPIDTLKEFKLLNKNNKPHTNFICCKSAKTVAPNGTVTVRPFRLLPEGIEKKRNYRIAVLGKARSGKTTFISRLFNITGGKDMTMIKPEEYEFFRYYNIKSYSPSLLSRTINRGAVNQEERIYTMQSTPYYAGEGAEANAKQFFNRYSISFADKKFILPTVTGEAANTAKYPFIFKVNNDAYVNIYDIAGEDVENASNILNSVTKGDNVSLIIVIDLSKDISVNENILINARQKYLEYKDTCPVAIVLSKFDSYEHEFNSNCACLNGDYSSLFTKNLNGSSLIHHIDTSSDEIESYLKKNNIDIRKTYFEGFNLKFFSVSAITYSDAMYHEDNADKTLEKNGLNFSCTSKRIELPLLWILHELGEI